ncbi:MAG: SlyX family protein [Lysobacter sp.]|nr:SlyX family protein [Lysobacter sp.]
MDKIEVATLEQRLAELEIRLAFQEHALGELSDALAATRMESIRNGERLRRVLDELSQARDGVIPNLADEPPPPHY